MILDMKFFNVYYFCHLANESMGKFEYVRTNAEFNEMYLSEKPKDFPEVSILRNYCYWLVDRVFYEQINNYQRNEEFLDFNPILWIQQAILKYRNIDISENNKYIFNYDDCLESYYNYTQWIEETFKVCIDEVFYDIATEVEYILFQNRDFLLRFNTQVSCGFENDTIERAYIPEWVKRAIVFRDRGKCVFCKRDLSGLNGILDDFEKQFDHIVSLNEGGINDVCNIQLTCKECNNKKLNSSMTSSIYDTAY